MKVALAQMRVIPGDLTANLSNMCRFVKMAKEQDVDLIAFPEMCTHGYLVGDQWLDDNFCRQSAVFTQAMLELSQNIAIAWGGVYLDEGINERTESQAFHPNKDGRIRRYNCVYLVQNQRLIPSDLPSNLLPPGIWPKTLLPNYRFFDDERYFYSLKDLAIDFNFKLDELVRPFSIQTKEGLTHKVLFQICEDMWAKDYRMNKNALNVTKMGVHNGAEFIVNLSASPWTNQKNDARDRRIQYLYQQSKGTHKPFFYVNCVGVQNNGKNFITFDGGSTIYNQQGEPVKIAAKPHEESLLCFDTQAFSHTPVVPRKKLALISEKYNAVVQSIRSLNEIRQKPKPPNFVIGLSGGVDSAVVAALLVKAVGPEHVIAVNMPGLWNSPATLEVAQSVANSLGISYYQIPIQGMVQSVEEALNQYFCQPRGVDLGSLTRENIQAKVRGTSILSNIAGNEHCVFTNNGNKLEIALGYATLYGDVGGAIAPIGDLLKTEVFEMAHFLNEEIFSHKVIPEALLPDLLYRFSTDQIPPSAELKADQTDPMKFGYHDALLSLATDYNKWDEEKILIHYRDKKLHHLIGAALGKDSEYGLALMKRWGVDRAKVFTADLRWFLSSIQANVFKRVQAPGIVITSKSSYGYDIRESMLPYYVSEEVNRLSHSLLDYDSP